MGTKKSSSRSQHTFAQIPKADIQRSSFNRSSGYKTTFDAGNLIPIFADEVLPGDTYNLKTTIFARVATLLFPIMDNLYIDVQYFFIPNRLVWNNWEKFNGAQDAPGDSTDFLIPTTTADAVTGHLAQGVYDYLGIPTLQKSIVHSNMFARAYNLTWNQWYRDENLVDPAVVDLDDGPDNYADYKTPLKRGKRHDYFSSCLPWPQKGPAVDLPLGTSAPIVSTGDDTPVFAIPGAATVSLSSFGTTDSVEWTSVSTSTGSATWVDPKLEVDLTSATAATINSLRQAFQIQRLYERDARGGTRYVEVLKSHFGVSSPDQRLQRVEYLGGGTQPVMLTPVAQTNDKAGDPLGELGAYGVAQGSGSGFTKSFVEHGMILGLASARADLNYQQGLNRMHSRSTRWDFFWPALAHLGEQSVLNQEIYMVEEPDAQNQAVFGYQERFAEYRYRPSLITGKMRSNDVTTLDAWHLAQEFEELPVLDSEFIMEDPPMNRIVAVDTEPDFLLDVHFTLTCARPMPTYSVPGLIDHF